VPIVDWENEKKLKLNIKQKSSILIKKILAAQNYEIQFQFALTIRNELEFILLKKIGNKMNKKSKNRSSQWETDY